MTKIINFGLYIESGEAHSRILGSDMRQEQSTGQGLSKEPKYVKIGCWNPEIIKNNKELIINKNLMPHIAN
jgi:hypothetical protein